MIHYNILETLFFYLCLLFLCMVWSCPYCTCTSNSRCMNQSSQTKSIELKWSIRSFARLIHSLYYGELVVYVPNLNVKVEDLLRKLLRNGTSVDLCLPSFLYATSESFEIYSIHGLRSSSDFYSKSIESKALYAFPTFHYLYACGEFVALLVDPSAKT